jgi:hypothetical protein
MTELRHTRQGYVYFMRAVSGAGLIKIGFSRAPSMRLYGISLQTNEPMCLLGFAPATIQDERRVHNLFAYLHKGNEWFEPNERLFHFIAVTNRQGTLAGKSHCYLCAADPWLREGGYYSLQHAKYCRAWDSPTRNEPWPITEKDMEKYQEVRGVSMPPMGRRPKIALEAQ